MAAELTASERAAVQVPVDGVSAELARKLRQPGFGLDVGSGQVRYPAPGLVIPQGRVCVELVMVGSGGRWARRVLAGYVDRPQVVALITTTAGAAVGPASGRSDGQAPATRRRAA